MSKIKKYLILFAIVPLLAFIAVSCVPAGPAPTGAVEVHVTDPGWQQYNISSINVTASAVEIHKAGGEGEEGEWISLNITMPTFDLIEIKVGGLEKILASANVSAGNYTQIRVTIEEVKVTLDGETKNAMVPSNKLKFVRPFQVVEGNKTVLTLDFDAGKSVKVTGAGKVIVRPVVTLDITRPSE